MLKIHYFSTGFLQFNNARGQLLRSWTKKAICSKSLEKIFEKFEKVALENCEKRIILGDFSKYLRNPALIVCAFGRKRQVIGNFAKNVETFENIPSEDFINALFNKPCVNFFSPLEEKDNSLEILEDFRKF